MTPPDDGNQTSHVILAEHGAGCSQTSVKRPNGQHGIFYQLVNARRPNQAAGLIGDHRVAWNIVFTATIKTFAKPGT